MVRHDAQKPDRALGDGLTGFSGFDFRLMGGAAGPATGGAQESRRPTGGAQAPSFGRRVDRLFEFRFSFDGAAQRVRGRRQEDAVMLTVLYAVISLRRIDGKTREKARIYPESLASDRWGAWKALLENNRAAAVLAGPGPNLSVQVGRLRSRIDAFAVPVKIMIEDEEIPVFATEGVFGLSACGLDTLADMPVLDEGVPV